MMNKPIDKTSGSDSLATPEKWYLKCDDESAARRALYAARAQQDCKSLKRHEKSAKTVSVEIR